MRCANFLFKSMSVDAAALAPIPPVPPASSTTTSTSAGGGSGSGGGATGDLEGGSLPPSAGGGVGLSADDAALPPLGGTSSYASDWSASWIVLEVSDSGGGLRGRKGRSFFEPYQQGAAPPASKQPPLPWHLPRQPSPAAAAAVTATATADGGDEGAPLAAPSPAGGSTSTSEARKGTGLGLPLAGRLVELMGGHVALTSSIDNRTRFIVRIPLFLTSAEVLDARLVLGDALDTTLDTSYDGALLEYSPTASASLISHIRSEPGGADVSPLPQQQRAPSTGVLMLSGGSPVNPRSASTAANDSSRWRDLSGSPGVPSSKPGECGSPAGGDIGSGAHGASSTIQHVWRGTSSSTAGLLRTHDETGALWDPTQIPATPLVNLAAASMGPSRLPGSTLDTSYGMGVSALPFALSASTASVMQGERGSRSLSPMAAMGSTREGAPEGASGSLTYSNNTATTATNSSSSALTSSTVTSTQVNVLYPLSSPQSMIHPLAIRVPRVSDAYGAHVPSMHLQQQMHYPTAQTPKSLLTSPGGTGRGNPFSRLHALVVEDDGTNR